MKRDQYLKQALAVVRELMKGDGLDESNVVDRVAQKSGVPAEEIRGKSRRSDISTMRHAAFYLLRAVCGMKYEFIADMTGFHHTSVLYGVKHIEDELKTYAKPHARRAVS